MRLKKGNKNAEKKSFAGIKLDDLIVNLYNLSDIIYLNREMKL